MHAAPAAQLQCMEVWGGNHAVSTSLAMPGLDAWIYSQPDGGAEGGGDVHYASSCASGAMSRILLADVSGHGLAVAELARRLRKLMQRNINQHKQTRFVEAMNREFAELASAGKFATALAFSFEAPRNALTLCNAGHPPPLIYRQAQKCWSYLEQPRTPASTNFPLGIEDVEYEEVIVPVQVGDIVLAYTDALPEARIGENDMLGQDGLLRIVQGINVINPSHLIQDLLSAIDAKAAINDDLTVLLFRTNGSRKHIPFTDRLVAPFKVLRALAKPYGNPNNVVDVSHTTDA
jgi:serine phosphatase RsbU (regulator of sigma subunit)